MILEIIEPYLVGGAVGFIVGAIATRIYFKSKIEMKNIGQVIEYAMVHKDITRLCSMAMQLEKLALDIEECSEDITNRLELSKDIEPNLIIREEDESTS
jgi:hypothetical protein